MTQIDLNSDLGEGFGPWTMGDDAAMLGLVSSANIACGGHAGDAETMFATLRHAVANGVTVGAHPGYADQMGFGRRIIPMAPAEVGRMVAAQIGSLQAMAQLAGAVVRYVKPHGALANLAADDAGVAQAITDAVRALSPGLALLAISGTVLEATARAAGVQVFSEVFADRGYLPNGRLVPRGQAGAMIHDPDVAVARLLAFLQSGRMPVVGGDAIPLAAQSICVHGDSPGAVQMAGRIRAGLLAEGIGIAAFLPA
ncbi:MAG: 5-oxoprolinase subunit PxpA [Pseudomonadota bacterium]